MALGRRVVAVTRHERPLAAEDIGGNMEPLKRHKGFLFPAYDERCWRFVFKQRDQFDGAMRYVKNRNVVVQAGGNVGVWPKWFAERFAHVYSFEADPTNFRCLCRNCPEENVFKFNAALGDKPGCVNITRVSYKGEQNCGGNYVTDGGVIPTLVVDDLMLPTCDLIQLDIEGYEFSALKGAEGTIKAYRPVVMIEDKGHGKRYGGHDGECRELLESWGMKRAEIILQDHIYIWP